jgi:hypothetical protein
MVISRHCPPPEFLERSKKFKKWKLPEIEMNFINLSVYYYSNL